MTKYVKYLSAFMLIVGVGFALLNRTAKEEHMPESFVYLSDIDPSILQSTRYHSNENFMGRVIEGYQSNDIVITKAAAEKLKAVNNDFKAMGYTLVVYDAYRPQRAVDSFVVWSKDPTDQAAKADYYPTLEKSRLFELEYIAEKSGHTRGSTVDLSIIDSKKSLKPIERSQRQLSNGDTVSFLDDNTLDMGSSFDIFHEVSHHDSPLISEEQLKLRNLLRNTMKKHGFKMYQSEWWHYTLEDEPFPNIYFNFVVQNKKA